MIVRPATLADAAAIAALHADSWRSAYRGILSDAYLDGAIDADRLALWQARLSPAGSADQFVAVVEADDRLHAFVCVLLDADPSCGALLDNLHVLPASKGRGLGRRLMRDAARWVQARRPGSRMHLWVFEQNQPARAFYEHLGGVVDGRQAHHAPDGSQADALRYCWHDLEHLAASEETIDDEWALRRAR